MKSITKTIMILSFFLALSSGLMAQTNQFRISVNTLTTNFNYGKSNSSLQSYKKNFTGLQAGFSYQAGISKRFSVVPELYFAIKGGTLKSNNPITESRSTLKLYSLEMPVMARLHIRKFYANAGPYASYHIGGHLKTEGTTVTPSASTKLYFGKNAGDFTRWDMGLQAGAGYNFNVKSSILTLDLRYGYGLVNVSRDVARYSRMLNISLQFTKLKTKNAKQKHG